MHDPIRYCDVNVTGTANLLEQSLERGVERFVFASSSAVYGDYQGHPFTESDLPKPESVYGANKAAGEQLCDVYALAGMPTISLRFFNAFGPRQSLGSAYTSVIPKFIQMAHQQEALGVFGDGGQTRDFVYVDDIADITIRAADTVVTGAYNVASGYTLSVNQLISALSYHFDELTVEHREQRAGDVKHTSANISRSVADLGLVPSDARRFRAQLSATVGWYINHLTTPSQATPGHNTSLHP
jgi:nucleoside-diphosphate-sugar epimerase